MISEQRNEQEWIKHCDEIIQLTTQGFVENLIEKLYIVSYNFKYEEIDGNTYNIWKEISVDMNH